MSSRPSSKSAAASRFITIAMTLVIAGQAEGQIAKPKSTTREGQQDPSVSAVVVTGGMTPVPQVGGEAPQFAPEELQSASIEARLQASSLSSQARRCDPGYQFDKSRLSLPGLYRLEQEANLAMMSAADKAREATLRANDLRIAHARGAADQSALEQAELARQAAVSNYLTKRDEADEASLRSATLERVAYEVISGTLPDYMIKPEYSSRLAQRTARMDLQSKSSSKYGDLVISDLQAIERSDGKAMKISGRIYNPRSKVVVIPALSFTALDNLNIVLAKRGGVSKRPLRIAAKRSAPFAYEFEPRPINVTSVHVTVSDDEIGAEHLPIGMFCEQSSNRNEMSPYSPAASELQKIGVNHLTANDPDVGNSISGRPSSGMRMRVGP